MANKNLLAMLKLGDATHYLFREFLQSLPDETEKVFDSFGYVGTLEGVLRGHERKLMRHFALFRSPTFNDLNTGYFTATPGAALIDIPDRLRVKVDFKQQDTDVITGAESISTFNGTIDAAVKRFGELSSKDPRKLLLNGLNRSEFLRDNMTKRRMFGFGTAAIVPTYISVGLETPDGRYLLGTTGAQGPYAGGTYVKE